ncbi:peptidase P60 [Chelativorans sp. Marseille-P2723]|uniref:peptidase P60 n=1 Tax=Chelativorans sp. Marseille-P2723 TaxID=2709133 RepID=UPI00156DBED6|nr:peptidase P60 [Chelativorans sp. Marseille-P2723]
MSTSDIAAAARPEQVIAEALSWVGTPYRHQASRKGVACDCVGLLLGICRGLYGRQPVSPGPYTQDWLEAGGEERLLDGMRQHFIPCGDALLPGRIIVFRWRPHLPAKHLGILTGPTAFAHAYEGRGVLISRLVPQWRRRIAGVFEFPASLKR